MLRILVAFIAITTIKPWKSYSTPCTRFHYSDNSSTSPHPGYGDFVACAMSESFLSHDMSPDDNIMGSTWHLYNVVTGHEIYNTGPMTHGPGPKTYSPGPKTHSPVLMTQPTSYALSIQVSYQN